MESEVVLEVRALVDGAEMVSVQERVHMAYDGGVINSLDSTGLEAIKGGLLLSTGGGACGVSMYSWHVLWDGSTLFSLPILSSVGDAGAFYESYEYIYPSQLPEFVEVKDKIYVRHALYETGGSDVDQYDEISYDEKTVVRPLIWNGKKYVLPKLD